MVMEKRNISSSSYNYGNVAYDFDADIKKKVINKNKKAKKNKIENAIRFKAMVSIMILSILSMIALYRFAYIIKINGDIRSIKSQIATIQNNNQNAIVEVAKINNIKEIEKVATTKYGMVKAEDSKTFYYEKKALTK